VTAKLNFKQHYSGLQRHMILQKSFLMICRSRNISYYHQCWKHCCI